MPKLKFDDPIQDMPVIRKKRSKVWKFVLLILIVIIFGSVSGVGSIILLSENNGSIAKKLGIKNWDNLTIPLTETKKVNLEESSSFIDAINKVSPAVVSIVSKGQAQNMFGQLVESEGAGTGFIITSDGLILTNKHVVSDSAAAYTVITSDGKSLDATIQSTDPLNDLAVIKVDARNLPVVELGDSDSMNVGQWVIGVGNALGKYQNTVTVGVVSAKDRTVEASSSTGDSTETLTGMLQTDTAINSGNSGGPLVNILGQVIGINTAVASNAQGIGFAIPINMAKSAIDSIKKTGKIIRPYIGIRYLPVTADVAKTYSLKYDYGVIVLKGNGIGQVAVVAGSPAEKAGIVENDVILEIAGERIDSSNSLTTLIQKHNVGDTVALKIYHNGELKDVNITLEETK